MRTPVRTHPAAPVRHVHLGLGNFFRAHQAWYTQHAPDGGDWGIAAFSGMRAGVAPALARQQGLYTLVARGSSDQVETISSLSAVHAADDRDAWTAYLARPDVSLVTCTVTEAGYRLARDRTLDLTDAVIQRDLAALRHDVGSPVGSASARLVVGLAARRATDAGPLTVISCDNLPENGSAVAASVLGLAEAVDPALAGWARESVTFVGTVVDRITPRPTQQDVDRLRWSWGVDDPAVVVTEPYAEWVIDERVTADRPAWEAAGALIVPEVARFEARKLRLLNGAHSLLAYAGLVRGHATVSEAIRDELLLGWVRQWWADAARYLDFSSEDVAAYTDQLLDRFSNQAIVHRLEQIAADGSQKVPARFAATMMADRASGRVSSGAVRSLAAWLCYLRTDDRTVVDPAAARMTGGARTGDWSDGARVVLAEIEESLVDDTELVDLVVEAARELVATRQTA